MLNQSLTINNSLFAKQKSIIDGDLSMKELPRLAEWLELSDANGDEGIVYYQLKGDVDAAKQPILYLSLDANLVVACQRCAEAMPWPLQLDFTYRITRLTEEEILNAEGYDELDDEDLITEAVEMDMLTLIEDELIAAMPYSPAHEEECVALKKEVGEKPNPFAVLKDLKLAKDK